MFQLRDEHVKKFHNDGYLIVENLFDVGDLEPLRRRIEELSSADGVNLTKGRRQVEPRVEMGEEVPMEGYASSLRKMAHVAFEDPIFLEHAREDRIIDIIIFCVLLALLMICGGVIVAGTRMLAGKYAPNSILAPSGEDNIVRLDIDNH